MLQNLALRTKTLKTHLEQGADGKLDRLLP